VNIFYVSIRTTENYQFDKFRTAGVTGNAIINSQGQGDNPVCSTRDGISQPSRPFSPRAAIGTNNIYTSYKCTKVAERVKIFMLMINSKNLYKIKFSAQSTGHCVFETVEW